MCFPLIILPIDGIEYVHYSEPVGPEIFGIAERQDMFLFPPEIILLIFFIFCRRHDSTGSGHSAFEPLVANGAPASLVPK